MDGLIKYCKLICSINDSTNRRSTRSYVWDVPGFPVRTCVRRLVSAPETLLELSENTIILYKCIASINSTEIME